MTVDFQLFGTSRWLVLGIHFLSFVWSASEVSFWTQKLWQRRDDFGISERKKSLVRIMAHSILCFMTGLVMSSWIFVIRKGTDKKYSQWMIVTYYIINILNHTAFVAACICVCARAWLVYYDVSLAAANADDQWMALITHPVIYRPEIVASLDKITPSLIQTETKSNIFAESVYLPRFLSQTSNKEQSVIDKPSNIFGKFVKSVGLESRTGETGTFTKPKMSFTASMVEKNPQLFATRSVALTLVSVHDEGDSNENWFMRKKNTLGNERWFVQRLLWISPVLGLFFSVVYISWILASLGRLFSILLYIAVTIFPAWITYHFPKTNDSLRIINELRCCSIILCLISMGVIFYTALVLSAGETRFLWWISLDIFVFFAARAVCIIQTKWVLLTFPSLSETGQIELAMKHSHTGEIRDISFCRALFTFEWIIDCCMHWFKNEKEGNTEEEIKAMASLSSGKKKKHLKVTDLLENEIGFRAFMKHLFNEFSYESLLCVIELQQFHDCMSMINFSCVLGDITEEFEDDNDVDVNVHIEAPKKHGETMSSIEKIRSALRATIAPNSSSSNSKSPAGSLSSTILDEQSTRVQFPHSIETVKSSISWDTDLSKEQKFCVLCKKYILMDAEMSVNISFDTRQKLIKKCDYYLKGVLPNRVTDEESLERVRDDLIIDEHCFNDVITELIRLMRDSLSRFQRTDEYEVIRKSIFND